MSERLGTILAVLVLCLAVSLVFAGDSGRLKVGVARVDITPDTPVQMAGYAGRKDLSAGVHDNLTARVLVFELEGSRLALVSTDIIGFHGGAAEPLQEAILSRTGLEPAELFLSAIHTHAGPSLALDPTKSHPNNIQYTERLKGKLADLVASGLKSLQPASVGIGVGSSPVGVNRRELRIDPQGKSSIVLGRNPYGPTDKEVLVLRVDKLDGTPLAVAFDYAVHGTSLGSRNLQISGDVLGLAEQVAERFPDSGGTALAFAGASGNINPWLRHPSEFNTEPGWVPEPVLGGTFLGQEVIRICREGLTPQPADRLRTAFRVLRLPAKNVSEGEIQQGSLPFVITAARLGDIAFIGLGGEVLTEIGLTIKAGSPCRNTFVITHCNGSAGYLVPKHLYVEGGYEVGSTRFSPEAAEIVVRESLGLLHGL